MQNLIIYKLTSLYHILEELRLNFKFNIFFVDKESILKDKIKDLNDYLIISQKKQQDDIHQITLENEPIHITKFLEKINIQFLKLQFNNQSNIRINNYIIDLNAKEMTKNKNKLKLTEKEIKIITYLRKKNKPVDTNELQDKVWSYQSNMETHTVETHIYRLRKKLLKTFDDNEFIISTKNGYQIK
ncbi:winged helix-turn-helix domain-containing protein [Candidatus Pelagibacter sp.]|nr:winged helix-turn-helix domain-containing protein [Candidatus Pelagibacter sp.]